MDGQSFKYSIIIAADGGGCSGKGLDQSILLYGRPWKFTFLSNFQRDPDTSMQTCSEKFPVLEKIFEELIIFFQARCKIFSGVLRDVKLPENEFGKIDSATA